MKKVDHYNFFIIYKTGWNNLLPKNIRKIILNRAKHYNKKLLKDNAKNKYRELSEEKNIWSEKMEEIDFTICLKKRNKDFENIKKVIVKLKIKKNNLTFSHCML